MSFPPDFCDSSRPLGLYDPAFEHDACGVGLLCNIDDEPSHAIVQQGLDMLMHLAHRGACGCDEKTGDGAGILIQLPDAFLRERAAEQGVRLPEAGGYGCGLVFLPTDAAERRRCQALLEAAAEQEGQRVLGWRRVPTRNAHIGVTARALEPSVWQVFVGRAGGLTDNAFERTLYVIRRVAERAVAASDLAQKACFHLPSLSSRTLIYKGMLTPDQLAGYYPDLSDPALASALALVHSRFSTNTMPRWPLAQPFRYLAHNGEINTLRGNVNWMRAREALFASERLGDDLAKVSPVIVPGGSDSAQLDNAVELLYHAGRPLPHVIMMLVPEAWQHHEQRSDARQAFYEYHACLTEPWDGPATIPFTDGRYVGAVLDRNGLRPSRYTVTRDRHLILSSETGVLDVDPANVLEKGRLQPGRMLLVDLAERRIIPDEEIKEQISQRRPYRAWLTDHLLTLDDLPAVEQAGPLELELADLRTQQQRFGYTLEDLRILMAPMGRQGKEAIGSMGDDTPMAVLSERPRLLYDYFRQLFAQVTNPPLDAIREELVTSLITHLGAAGNLLAETPQHARRLRLNQPILTPTELAKVRALDDEGLRAATLRTVFDVDGGGAALAALDTLCAAAERAVDDGAGILILSDRDLADGEAPIPALLATAAVHHHLIRTGRRAQCELVVESGEPREVHHACLLLGYGAAAICPYLALATIHDLVVSGEIEGMRVDEAVANYVKALGKGILKVMSKMGISTLQSYRGAQIFEAVGVSRAVIDRYFTGTVSRLDGIGLDVIAEEARQRHAQAFPQTEGVQVLGLDVGGRYQWRRGGEHHTFAPLPVAKLQHAVRQKDHATYDEFAAHINAQNRALGTLRGLLGVVDAPEPVPLDEVEPWTEIVKRFKTGAMSYGSISQETHETLAVAMNRLGGKSNTGEGGENPARYDRANPRRSAIKQVASGRFGVTMAYLSSADEIQIKMAQGAKPGEGGQLPGEKVYPWIAETRHATPYVGLISPPPHHDIYSIEDLAQLIHDLKNANPQARISVKLVSEVGVGTVAAGVAKGKADVVLISGSDGGTGASPQGSIAHAGLPWELGLAETHQTLVHHGLRSRITIECDGQMKTGRDVVIAALLGADEFGFATAPLVALGCIMMRKCHLNTCPVGIATQNPELRKLFSGAPEHVVNYFYFVAREVRQLMARLGFRTFDDMVGRVDRLRQRDGIEHWKARHLDLSPILTVPETPDLLKPFSVAVQQHGLADKLDHGLIEAARPTLERGEPVTLDLLIRNVDRTLGTMLSHEIVRRYGEAGLPDDTVMLRCRGSAGQSFGAFAAPGLTLRVEGDANDYLGKGLSGGQIVVVPHAGSTFAPEHNILIGNVALYGATSGALYVRGQAGERFAVRNSGAHAVVEGVGDHGCEYMTGGRVVVLGPTGRNFAAGMSGGVAYVLDGTWDFRRGRCNREMVELLNVTEPDDVAELRALVKNHLGHTGSNVARWVLDHWDVALREFVKVMPVEYRKALRRLEEERPDLVIAA